MMTVSVWLIGSLLVVIALSVWSCSERDVTAAAPTDDEAPAAPSDHAGRKPNRLIHATSPYLLQHAYNPVDWREWGPEALAAAKEQDKPIFLSVGYSTCHWCHVMAHESFEDEEVAAYLNEHFIPIKVDREERPDVDEQYMLATQLMTQRGGWPNSVWLTPDGRPWYAGTYFPKPQFMQLMQQLTELWRDRRDEVNTQADRLSQAIRQIGSGAHLGADRPLSPDIIERAVQQYAAEFDGRHGGFGDRPKFPPHGGLALLVDQYRRTKDEAMLSMIVRTLDAMAMGGVRDHIGGGFHRYSTDERWFLPHFEKMLYDNAQLMRAYTDGFGLTRHEGYRQIVREIFTWIDREMTDERGGFYSALDADSEGEEGKFYVWHRDEIIKVLGADDGELFCDIYGAVAAGNFRDEASGHQSGTNVIHLPRPIAEVAVDKELDEKELRRRLADGVPKLLAVRDRRIRPHLDDKVLASWNGMMIGALAYAGRHLDEPKYVAAAERAADFVLQYMQQDGKLMRSYRKGKAHLDGYLDDYALMADGLLELHATTGDSRWLTGARQLADAMRDRFEDKAEGGFFFTSAQHEQLLLRTKEAGGGGNVPSGNGVAAHVLLRLAELTGDSDYLTSAQRCLDAMSILMWQQPRAAETQIVALALYYEKFAEREAPGDEPDASAAKPPVKIGAYLSHTTAAPGQTLHVALRLNIDNGWHIYANDAASDNLVATKLTLQPNDHVKLGQVKYPQANSVEDDVLKLTLKVYKHEAWLVAPITVADSARGDVTFELALQTQACDDRSCLAPETHTLELTINISDTPQEDQARHDEVFKSLDINTR